MKNKKMIIIASICSFIVAVPILMMGLKAITKYCNTSNDWHYIAGLIGSILMGSFMFSIVGFIIIFMFQKRK